MKTHHRSLMSPFEETSEKANIRYIRCVNKNFQYSRFVIDVEYLIQVQSRNRDFLGSYLDYLSIGCGLFSLLLYLGLYLCYRVVH